MHDTTTANAAACLSELFFEALEGNGDMTFESFEDRAMKVGHDVMARALETALERLDARLACGLRDGLKIHDLRVRRLAAKMGDVEFRCHRVRDEYGCTVVPLADELGLPWRTRISPAARSWLVDAGAEVSYSKAARLLESAGGSHVSPTAVMKSIHDVGSLCAEEDALAASELFENGVAPESKTSSEQVNIEVDGTWIRLQGIGPDESERAETKALAAYSGKSERGRKVLREDVVRHACAGSPETFWTQGVAAAGTMFDLAKIESCHVGQDGEGWCGRAAEFLPEATRVTPHLDPFHVNRAVLSCFSDPKAGWHVLDVLWDGDREEACTLLEAFAGLGIAREKRAEQVLKYLRNNMGILAVEGPSLGTMESENQHVYGARMDGVPCAWSRSGASAMARIRSRRHSDRALPRPTREGSLTPKMARRREERVLAALKGPGAARVVKSVESGYLPPHHAHVQGMSADVKYAAGIDSAMAWS